MTIFGDNDGQAVVDSLSDEAIYGTVEETEAETERQENDAPQSETEAIEEQEEASPGENQTSEDGGKEDAPAQAGQADIPVEEQLRQLQAANEKTQKNYDNLRSWANRVDSKNKQLEERNKLLETQLQQLRGGRNAGAEMQRRDNLRNLINSPEEVIARQVQQQLEPILKEREENKQRADFNEAVKECSRQWPQFQDAENHKRIIEEMVTIARQKGLDPMAWRNDAQDYMILACHRLFGVPRVTDPAALEAAKKAGREEALKEMEAKRNKSGLSLVPNANNDPTDDQSLTPEEEIRKAMWRYSSHGIFD